ncbi:MAG: hypothetical protein QOG09_1649, partial [Solirubrobacterales bacterium]|nr:hypothetical protein [Solirubrobacterales bacterium]
MPANAAKTATGKSLALALAFFVVLVSLALHVGLAKAGITVQVTNCTDPNQPPEKCHTTTPPKNGGSSHGTELHQYSLGKSQARQVRGPQGDQLTLDLAQEAKKQAAAAAPLVTDKMPKRIKRKPGSAGVGTVSTNGGSAFSGFGSDFNFVSGDEALSRFAIPPFLLPIYVSAGRAYGVPWNVLASINQIETDFGRISNQVSSAGAEGWMQFMPASWKTYGVDASGDGVADPYNPVDAIYAAARYLRAAGGDKDIRKAVFAYNHAGWYVDRVMSTAGIYGSLPSGLVAETGSLAFGHFPVHGRVLYGDDFRRAVTTGHKPSGLKMFPRTKKATAVATQDVTVARILVDR